MNIDPKRKPKERKRTLMLSPVWIMMFLHFWVGLSLHVIPKQELQELKEPQWLLPSFKGEQHECAWTSQPTPIFPKGKLPRFSHDQLKISSSPRYLHYDWVDRRWLDAPIYTLEIGLLVVTSFVHLWFHNTKIKGSTILRLRAPQCSTQPLNDDIWIR